MTVRAPDTAFGMQARGWRSRMLAEGRYERLDGDERLLSTLWREPRLAVDILLNMQSGQAELTAEETDLES